MEGGGGKRREERGSEEGRGGERGGEERRREEGGGERERGIQYVGTEVGRYLSNNQPSVATLWFRDWLRREILFFSFF